MPQLGAIWVLSQETAFGRQGAGAPATTGEGDAAKAPRFASLALPTLTLHAMGLSRVLLVSTGLAAGILVSAFSQDPNEESQAGTALEMDLSEVVDASNLVLEGRVVQGRSSTTEDGTIYTDWDIEVDRTWWGDDEPVRTVRIPGGVLSDGKGMVVPGMPSLAPGEDVVLMLSDESDKGLRIPTGLGQGKYRIVSDGQGSKKAIRTGEHMTLASTAGTLASGDGLSVLDYAELVAELEAATQRKRAEGEQPAAETESEER